MSRSNAVRKRGAGSIADDAAVQRFVDVAGRYCSLIERRPPAPPRQLLRGCVEILPELFAAALGLPQCEPSDAIRRELDCAWRLRHGVATREERNIAEASKYTRTLIPVSEFFTLSRRLRRVLGKWDLHRGVFDPYTEKEAMVFSLSNDLAEIWHDLKQDLRLLRCAAEGARRHAVYDQRFRVGAHWGPNHWAGAMKATLSVLGEIDDCWLLGFPGYKRRPKVQRRK